MRSWRSFMMDLIPKSLNSALLMSSKLYFRSYLSRGVKNVMLRLPRSWYTVPPPLLRLARAISFSFKRGMLASSHGFWCLPITTHGSFRHTIMTWWLEKSILRYIQSSRAKFVKMSVDWDMNTDLVTSPSAGSCCSFRADTCLPPVARLLKLDLFVIPTKRQAPLAAIFFITVWAIVTLFIAWWDNKRKLFCMNFATAVL